MFKSNFNVFLFAAAKEVAEKPEKEAIDLHKKSWEGVSTLFFAYKITFS